MTTVINNEQTPLIEHQTLQHLHNQFRSKQQHTNEHPLLETDCLHAQASIRDWPGYQPTPLISLTGLAKASGVNAIWYKNESPRFGLGSFKALGGAYAVSELLKQNIAKLTGREISINELTDGSLLEHSSQTTVCCATDGNHGRSVAWGAKRFGCRCVIYIHAEVSEGRRKAIEQYGAEVIRISGNYDDSVRFAASEAEKNDWTVVSDTSYPGYVSIPADVMRGYTLIADEVYDELEANQQPLPTHVLLQGGVGGFAAAITERVRARSDNPATRIIVAEPDQAACIYQSLKAGKPVAVSGDLDTLMAGLACGEISLLAFGILLAEVDDVVAVSDITAVECMNLLAKGVGGDQPLVAGESAVAGLATQLIAMQQKELGEALELNADSRVLIIGTEGATDPEVYQELTGLDPQLVEA